MPPVPPRTTRSDRREPTPQEIDTLVERFNQGRLDEVEALAEDWTRRYPRHAFGWKALGVVLSMTGRLANAIAPLRQSTRLQPDDVEAQSNLGGALQESGLHTEALASYRHALAVKPDHIPAHSNIGVVLRELGRPADARTAVLRALAIGPGHAEAHLNLGIGYAGERRPAHAMAAYRRALAIQPAHAKAISPLAATLFGLGDTAGAERGYRRALAISPQERTAARGLGHLYKVLGRLQDAEALGRQRLKIAAQDTETHRFLGGILVDGGRLEEARARHRSVLALEPGHAETLNELGDMLRVPGFVAEAITHNRRALAVSPLLQTAARSHLCALLYSDDATPEILFDQAVAFGQAHKPGDAPLPPPVRDCNRHRQLRIGFLSSDFRTHPIARNIRAIFEYRDRAAVFHACYSHTVRIDDATQWYRASADAWCDVTAMSDREVAERIREDAIDVLVVLGGRFDANRPLVAAYRPAPIQVSLHDGGTSGIDGMDWFVGDSVVTPENGPERFTERVTRLPVFYNHPPRIETPILPRGPAAGPVVFGSFNSPAKLSSTILSLWARILTRVPESRLVLKYFRAFESKPVCDRILAQLTQGGVDAGRITFLGATEYEDRPLARYGQIDIALDSYPFTGATTTFEALWMGVPVVTLAGGGFVGRASAGHLAPLGLEDLVASTPSEFVEVAVRLSLDRDRLAALRRSLRDRIRASPLTDGAGYARAVERLFRDLWRDWCDRAR